MKGLRARGVVLYDFEEMMGGASLLFSGGMDRSATVRGDVLCGCCYPESVDIREHVVAKSPYSNKDFESIHSSTGALNQGTAIMR